jgi:hypothetical protein
MGVGRMVLQDLIASAVRAELSRALEGAAEPVRETVDRVVKEAARRVAAPVALGVERLANDAAHRAVDHVLKGLWPPKGRR